MVTASVVMSEPEIDLTSPSAPPSTVPASTLRSTPTKATTTTTTTYTTPPPSGNAGGNMHGLGLLPCRMNCPYCAVQMTTRTQEQVGGVTILAVILLILLFWPLFWLPLCMPSCKTTEHYCGSCHRKVGQAEPCT